MVWLLLGYWALYRIRRHADAPPAWLAERYRSLRRSRHGSLPELIVSASVREAISWGLWRPVIALPQRGCRPDQSGPLLHVLLHELAHFRHRDGATYLLFNIAMPLLYWHPLYWCLRRQSRLAAELLADDWAASHSSAETYAQDLISYIKAGNLHAQPLGALAIFQSPTQFYRRMHMLLHRKQPLATSCTARWNWATSLCAGVGVAILTLTIGIDASQAQPGDSPASADELDQLRQERDSLRRQVEDLRAALDGLRAATEQPIPSDLAPHGLPAIAPGADAAPPSDVPALPSLDSAPAVTAHVPSIPQAARWFHQAASDVPGVAANVPAIPQVSQLATPPLLAGPPAAQPAAGSQNGSNLPSLVPAQTTNHAAAPLPDYSSAINVGDLLNIQDPSNIVTQLLEHRAAIRMEQARLEILRRRLEREEATEADVEAAEWKLLALRTEQDLLRSVAKMLLGVMGNTLDSAPEGEDTDQARRMLSILEQVIQEESEANSFQPQDAAILP
jgi:hypothetical protein